MKEFFVENPSIAMASLLTSALALIIFGICVLNGHTKWIIRENYIDKINDYNSYCKCIGIALMLYGLSLAVLGIVFVFNLFDMLLLLFVPAVWMIIAVSLLFLAKFRYCDK